MFGSPFASPPFGLVCYHDQQAVSLALQRVTANATIVDTAAQVRLEQVYTNDSTDTADAAYLFPVPARSAVCAFAMVKQDGTRIVGVVDEKEKAKQTYDEAVAAGKLASLAEQGSLDAFKCSVGNILPNETVTIELTYATELMEGDMNDSIRLLVPSKVGARYGSAPSNLSTSAGPLTSQPNSAVRFDVSVDVESAAPISKITSPSHTVSISLGPDPSLPNADKLRIANYARIAFSSATTLERDFVLELSSAELDSPRCIAEKHPSADSVAISLTVVPRFKLPELKNQEFVFLVDRSGSMHGDRIAMAKKALIVLLRSLPHAGTTFNIVSFGSGHDSLWSEGSRAYNQSTLDEATRHVDSMDANYGGTELRKALEDGAFALRKQDKATSIFVLTDGDAWDLDGVLNSVKSAVSSASAEAPLRVFVLGIGNSASTAMCEGVARQGGGIAQFVVDGESMTGKVTRLLKAAKTPPILNARLDFGVEVPEDDFELVEAVEEKEDKVEKVTEATASISLFDKDVDPLKEEPTAPAPEPEAVKLPPAPAVQQAPVRLRSVYPGSRLHAYAILTPASLLPDQVVLRGELASGQQLELPIPITPSQLSSSLPAGPPPIHVLAARKLVQDLEDGSHDLASRIKDGDLLARTVRAHVVRLGTTYSLASTHTSFVAVDESEVDKPRKRRETLPPPPRGPTLFGAAPGGAGAVRHRSMVRMAAAPPPPAPLMAAPVTLACAASPAAFGAAATAPAQASLFAAPDAFRSRGGGGGGALYGSASTASSPGGLFGSAPAAPPLPQKSASPFANQWPLNRPAGFGSSASASEPEQEQPASRSGGAGDVRALKSKFFGGAPAPAAPPTYAEPAAPAAPSPSDRLDALARLQAFDGSFSVAALPLANASSPLAELVRKLPGAMQGGERVEEAVAALVVLAFWEREMGDLRDEWEEMAGKARGFVQDALGVEKGEVDGLVALFA
ncbi:hypothetical protein JCM10207_008461 [Rhodosporidiobolus poonsookiae]